MSSLDAVLSQYEKNTQTGTSSSSGMSQEERMKKYFTCLLPEKSKEGQARIRILPTPDGSSPFKEVWFHEIQVGGKWQKFFDPGKNDNERSPLNELYEELMSTGKDSDKELAKQYRSRKFYIVKVVDRDHEEDGVKFWRFKHNFKNEGILDKIIPIWRAKGDVTDPEKGRDLIIQMNKAKTGNGKEYTNVQTIMYDDPAPLHENADMAKEWLNDELTWANVYSKKPIEYLEAIANGETPRWDNDLGKYVYGDSTESTTSMGGKSVSYSDPQAFDEASGDMPF
jgi:hypothetical protein